MVCWWNRSHGYFQDYKVCDRWGLVNGIWGGPWEWRFQLRDRALNDLSSLIDLIGNLSLSRDGIDSRSWSYECQICLKSRPFLNASKILTSQIVALARIMFGIHGFLGRYEVSGTSILILSSHLFHQNVAMGNICNLGCARLS
ncbi:hypothetical protein Tco_1251134 [Tanacetum coccineum]